MANVVQVQDVQSSGGNMFTDPINWIIVLVALLVFVSWKAFKARKQEHVERNKYKIALDMMRVQALKNADNRYFSGFYRTGKNAEVRRVFEYTDTRAVRIEPLIGNYSRYMGHYKDQENHCIITVCTGKKFFIFPLLEVMDIPGELVHFQDDHILINCVGMATKHEDTPYWPVVRNHDGQIVEFGFTLLDKHYEEKVSTQVIVDQGNKFVDSLNRMPNFNPVVKNYQKMRAADGGM